MARRQSSRLSRRKAAAPRPASTTTQTRRSSRISNATRYTESARDTTRDSTRSRSRRKRPRRASTAAAPSTSSRRRAGGSSKASAAASTAAVTAISASTGSSTRGPKSTSAMSSSCSVRSCHPSSGARSDSSCSASASAASGRFNDLEGVVRFRSGDVILDRYEIVSKAGQGTFGTVLQCYDRKRRENVALKVVRSVKRYIENAYVEIDVLDQIRRKDPRRESLCVRILKSFDETFHNQTHVFIATELLGMSLYEFLQKNDYLPFTPPEVKSFALQLLQAVRFCHGMKLIHTDLKLENILLVNHAFEVAHGYAGPRRQLRHTDVRLIDFGGATFEWDHHSSVVNTRQYRAPEVILGLGWSYPSDLWSVGCIITELVTGQLLFPTHENLEHVALMQHVLGCGIPRWMTKQSRTVFDERCRRGEAHSISSRRRRGQSVETTPDGMFTKAGSLRWPTGVSRDSVEHVKSCKPLTQLLTDPLLLDLVRKCLELDPAKRITAAQACEHPYFAALPKPAPNQLSTRLERDQKRQQDQHQRNGGGQRPDQPSPGGGGAAAAGEGGAATNGSAATAAAAKADGGTARAALPSPTAPVERGSSPASTAARNGNNHSTAAAVAGSAAAAGGSGSACASAAAATTVLSPTTASLASIGVSRKCAGSGGSPSCAVSLAKQQQQQQPPPALLHQSLPPLSALAPTRSAPSTPCGPSSTLNSVVTPSIAAALHQTSPHPGNVLLAAAGVTAGSSAALDAMALAARSPVFNFLGTNVAAVSKGPLSTVVPGTPGALSYAHAASKSPTPPPGTAGAMLTPTLAPVPLTFRQHMLQPGTMTRQLSVGSLASAPLTPNAAASMMTASSFSQQPQQPQQGPSPGPFLRDYHPRSSVGLGAGFLDRHHASSVLRPAFAHAAGSV